MLENLLKRYEHYENSEIFIKAVYNGFKKANISDKQIKFFLINHFMQNQCCDFISTKKLCSHWNKIAYSKLQLNDFVNYRYSMNTLVFYRILAHEMNTESEVKNVRMD